MEPALNVAGDNHNLSMQSNQFRAVEEAERAVQYTKLSGPKKENLKKKFLSTGVKC